MTVYGNNLGAPATYYCWEGGQVIADFRAGTSSNLVWEKSYVYLGGRLLATADISGTKYHHPDRLGARLITDTSGNVTTEQVNLPYGTALATESSGAISNRRFTSYDRSAETKLDYAVNRFYNAAQGRFTQVDPIGMSATSLGDPQTLNLYGYCGNDPINHVDPDGLFFGKLFKWIGKAIKAVAKVFAVVLAVAAVLAFSWGFGAIGVSALIGAGIFALAGWGSGKLAQLAAGVAFPNTSLINFQTPPFNSGAVSNFVQARPAPKPRPAKKPPIRLPGRIPAEGGKRIPDGWIDLWAEIIKGFLSDPSAKRAEKAIENGEPLCRRPQEHHAIPWWPGKRFNHQQHRLVTGALVNLRGDPRNVRFLYNHAGPHSESYHLEVNRRLEEAYNSMSAFSTHSQLNIALGKVIESLWRDIDNGTLKPYDGREVYLCK